MTAECTSVVTKQVLDPVPGELTGVWECGQQVSIIDNLHTSQYHQYHNLRNTRGHENDRHLYPGIDAFHWSPRSVEQEKLGGPGWINQKISKCQSQHRTILKGSNGGKRCTTWSTVTTHDTIRFIQLDDKVVVTSQINVTSVPVFVNGGTKGVLSCKLQMFQLLAPPVELVHKTPHFQM